MEDLDKLSQSPPLITVIVAVYNGAKLLQRCIDSIVKQTYKNIELIIIDGGSVDGTGGIINANNDNISYWESEHDRGIYHAWNKALDHAKGDWICFLGSDDFFWKSDVLDCMAEQLILVPFEIKLVYGKVAEVSCENEVCYIKGEHWGKAKKRLTEMLSIPHPGLMHRKSLFDLHGKFDESYKITGDYEFLLRELKTGDAVFIQNVIVAGMQRGGLSTSMVTWLEATREGARARKKNGIRVVTARWLWKYAKVFTAYWIIQLLGDKSARYAGDFYRVITLRSPIWIKANKDKKLS